MKKLITVILILALFLPAAALAADQDPIVGAWYIMLDYNEMPFEDDGSVTGKNYMLYVLIFEESGTISGFSGESVQGIGFYGTGSTLGTWMNVDGVYAATIAGIGTSRPTIEDDRLILRMAGRVHYSMRRLEIGSWTDDLVYRD